MIEAILTGIGEFLWDILPGGKRPGGAPANVAYHFKKLGGKGTIVSSVGDDDLGQELLEQLHMISLKHEYVSIDNDHFTGVSSIKLDSKGAPHYNIRENVAWDFIPWTRRLNDLSERTEAVVFGTLAQRAPISFQTIQRFVSNARNSALCILDINLRLPFYNRDIIENSLSLAHILKLNSDELQVLAGILSLEGNDYSLLSQILYRYKLEMIALTKGAEGSILFSDDKQSVHAGYKTTVIDTVGAGDAFTAMLAIGMLQGQSLETINDNANRLASYVCSMPGATPPLSEEFKELVRRK